MTPQEFNFNLQQGFPIYHKITPNKDHTQHIITLSHYGELNEGDTFLKGNNKYAVVSVDEKRTARGDYGDSQHPNFFKTTCVIINAWEY